MSSKIILNLAISLDGFIADESGGYDWIKPAGDSHLNTETIWSHEKFLESISTVVMGKRCYDQGFHEGFGNRKVYVATGEKLEDYENIHFVGDDICREVLELKRRNAGDIYLFGGGILIDAFLKAGIIDEYVIGIIPIILGKGIPLFLKNNPSIPLELAGHYVEDGIVVLRYTPRSEH